MDYSKMKEFREVKVDLQIRGHMYFQDLMWRY